VVSTNLVPEKLYRRISIFVGVKAQYVKW